MEAHRHDREHQQCYSDDDSGVCRHDVSHTRGCGGHNQRTCHRQRGPHGSTGKVVLGPTDRSGSKASSAPASRGSDACHTDRQPVTCGLLGGAATSCPAAGPAPTAVETPSPTKISDTPIELEMAKTVPKETDIWLIKKRKEFQKSMREVFPGQAARR